MRHYKKVSVYKLIIAIILAYYALTYFYNVYFNFINAPFVYPDKIRKINKEEILIKGMTFVGQNITHSVYMCQNTTKLLIAVISQADNFKERQIIRKTWGNYKTDNTEIRFVLGTNGKPFINTFSEALAHEQLIYKDLMLTTFPENYFDLSLKTLAAFVLTLKICPTAKCLLKSDSDNIVDIGEIKKLCEQHQNTEGIHGYCLEKPLVLRRSFASSKWNVPEFVYSPKNYPYYCRGGGYLVTKKSSIEKLLFSLDLINFFSSYNLQRLPEDVIFTGIAAKTAKIQRNPSSRFIPCILKNGTDCINKNALRKDWITAMIDSENMEEFYDCSLRDNWRFCVDKIMFKNGI